MYFCPVNQSHPIYYGVRFLSAIQQELKLQTKACFVLLDDGIPEWERKAFLGEFPAEQCLLLPGGESVKKLSNIERIWTFLLQQKADRNSVLINLGGGALCDAGGFAASTFKRGISFVHVPSTLLSMVDASVGGKTGINFGGTKNMVGSFAMPLAVFIQPALLHTLPERQLLSGYAEMIKHGLVADVQHLENVLPFFAEKRIPSEQLIRESIAIKSGIVDTDPLEKGERKLLNFGHSVGHAIESLLNENGETVLHGEAIAAGMLAEMYLSVQEEKYPAEEMTRFAHVLRPLTRHIHLSETDIPKLLGYMANDKKNEGAQLGVTLLQSNGNGVWGKTVSTERIKESLLYIVNK